MNIIIISIITMAVGIGGTVFFMKRKMDSIDRSADQDLIACQKANETARKQLKAMVDEAKKWQEFTVLADDIFVEVKGKLKCEQDIEGAIEKIDSSWRKIDLDC